MNATLPRRQWRAGHPHTNFNATPLDSGAVLLDLERGESPIPLTELPQQPFVPRRDGRPLHVSAPFRYVRQGKGGYRLEAAVCGGRLCTTRSAVLRFYARLSSATTAPK